MSLSKVVTPLGAENHPLEREFQEVPLVVRMMDSESPTATPLVALKKLTALRLGVTPLAWALQEEPLVLRTVPAAPTA